MVSYPLLGVLFGRLDAGGCVVVSQLQGQGLVVIQRSLGILARANPKLWSPEPNHHLPKKGQPSGSHMKEL